jgi:signal transduction histidine kinase
LRLPRIQEHPASNGFPEGHPPMTTFLGVPVTVRGQVFGNRYLTEKRDGQEFTAQDASLAEALARVAGFVIANALAFARTETRRAMLESVAELSDAGAQHAPGETLARVAVSARSAFGGDAVAVLLLTNDGYVIRASDGAGSTALADRLVSQRPAVEAAARGDGPRRFAWGIVVPVHTRVHASVALMVAPAPVDPDAPALLSSFAEQAGLALDRLQALGDRETLAVLSDRERIARDLHDLVIQRLFATGMSLESMRHQVLPQGQERLERLIEGLDTTIRDIRATIFELQRPVGSARTRVSTILEQAEAVLGFRPVLHVTGPVDTVVTGDVATHLEAVLRELLTNAARHARATEVTVELDAAAEQVTLVVTDDGKGMDADRPRSGLANADGRARQLGGSCELQDVDPHGTQVRWRVPVRPGRSVPGETAR